MIDHNKAINWPNIAVFFGPPLAILALYVAICVYEVVDEGVKRIKKRYRRDSDGRQ